jgi:hypothetical protein
MAEIELSGSNSTGPVVRFKCGLLEFDRLVSVLEVWLWFRYDSEFEGRLDASSCRNKDALLNIGR